MNKFTKIVAFDVGTERPTADYVDHLEAINAELLDVVRDCVNFLADFHTTAPFDMQFLTVRAKALHKRAYTAHSKAKSHADTLKGE